MQQIIAFKGTVAQCEQKADAHFCIRYPFPKSLSPGKGLTLGLSASNRGFRHAKLEYMYQNYNIGGKKQRDGGINAEIYGM